MKINKSQLNFTVWKEWSERNDFKNIEYPGVYMVAITRLNINGQIANYKYVSYIGMSNSVGGIKSRLKQFGNSINGKRGHSGGSSVRKKYGIYNKWPKGLKLFVCIHPVICNTVKSERTSKDLINMGWVAYLEYEALANFKKKFEKEPEFNIK